MSKRLKSFKFPVPKFRKGNPNRDSILGGSRLENGGNPPKINFQQILDHMPWFENYTSFDFQKNFFHSTLINNYCQQSTLGNLEISPLNTLL